jgi:hypothetical protein
MPIAAAILILTSGILILWVLFPLLHTAIKPLRTPFGFSVKSQQDSRFYTSSRYQEMTRLGFVYVGTYRAWVNSSYRIRESVYLSSDGFSIAAFSTPRCFSKLISICDDNTVVVTAPFCTRRREKPGLLVSGCFPQADHMLTLHQTTMTHLAKRGVCPRKIVDLDDYLKIAMVFYEGTFIPQEMSRTSASIARYSLYVALKFLVCTWIIELHSPTVARPLLLLGLLGLKFTLYNLALYGPTKFPRCNQFE